MITDNETLTAAHSVYGSAYKIYDDGFGPLWIYGESLGAAGIIRAQTFENALEIAYDEILTPIDESDLLDAFGLYVVETRTGFALCFDTNFHDNGHNEYFPQYRATHRVFRFYDTRELAETAGRKYIDSEELDLIKSYHFQANMRGSGIVHTDLNGDWLHQLTEDSARRFNVGSVTIEDEDGDTHKRVIGDL